MGGPNEQDLLTPREREVLALLREELSNEEIARRLGVSVAGVKYHVSEILGKLGLENRTDAARWAAAAPEERRPWWAAAIAPLRLGWVSGAVAVAAGVALAVGIGFLVWALASTGDGGSDVPANLADLTPANFYERVADAVRAEGKVYHVVTERSGEQGATTSQQWHVEAWIDFEGVVGREELDFSETTGVEVDPNASYRTIVIGDTEYSTDGTDSGTQPVQACDGVPFYAGISLPVLCDTDPDPELQAAIAAGDLLLDAEYTDAPAVSLAFESDIVSSDEEGNEVRTPSTTTFYADPVSLLPVARVLEVDVEGVPSKLIDTYDSELIDRAELPGDFFDPSAIGFEAPTPTPVIDPEEGLIGAADAGVTPYWLGSDYFGPREFESFLTFDRSAPGEPPGGGPGYRVEVTYEAVSAWGHGPVAIWLWEPSEWETYEDEAVSAMAFLGPCGLQEEIDVPGATRAVILAAREGAAPSPDATPRAGLTPIAPPTLPPQPDECPDRPFDRWATVIEYPDTVVTVNVPHCITCLERPYDEDPWDSRAGMLSVIAGLRVWPEGKSR